MEDLGIGSRTTTPPQNDTIDLMVASQLVTASIAITGRRESSQPK